MDKQALLRLLKDAPVKRASFKNPGLAKIAAARLLGKMYDEVEKRASIDVFDAGEAGASALGFNKRRVKQVAGVQGAGVGGIGGAYIGQRIAKGFGGGLGSRVLGGIGGAAVGAVAGKKITDYLSDALTD